MHRVPTSAPRTPTAARAALFAICAAALWLATACGGVGTGGTGSFTMGPIGGFGSVIVNGISFDDDGAVVEDDDGVRRSRDDLRLGMIVEVESAPISGGRAVATRMRVASELRGEIESVDIATRRFRVLGQTVQVDAHTLYGDGLPFGALGLLPGRIVEVHGQVDADGPVLRATRIDLRLAALSYKLRGPVAAVDTGARTLRIGSEVFSYAGATVQPVDPAGLRWARLLLRTERNALGQWSILAFGPAEPAPPAEAAQWSIQGLITQFGSATSFNVNGLPVNASAATFPDGTAGLARGVRVTVTGEGGAGTLVASRVEIETDAQRQARGFALTGPVGAVDAAARTLVLRGITVGWGRSDLVFVGGGPADLVDGRRILLQGVVGADGTRLEAVRIQFL